MKKVFLSLFGLILTSMLFAQQVSIDGNRFTLGGSEIWFNGINTPWHLFGDFGRHDFVPSWWEDEFARYKQNNINLARVWIHMSGEFSPNIDATGYVTGVDDMFWDQMDHLMNVSEQNGVYVMPALFSFDITKNGYATTAEWRNWIQSEANIQSYIDNVMIPMMARYDNRPYLLAWEICNEPEWMFENTEHGPQSFHDVQKMHAMLAAAVHEHSTKFVTTGSAAPKWNAPIYDHWGEYEGNMFSDSALAATINNPNAYLDFYQYHWYAWQSEYMASPFTQTTAEYGVDDRPVIVGESEGNPVCDQYVCQTVPEMYESAFMNGFDGVCAWKTPQNDGHGTFENIAEATNAFYAKYPNLIYPDGSDPVAVTGIVLSDTNIRIEEGQTANLTAVVLPDSATDKRVSWSSANTSTATVSNGTVTGVLAGETIITAATRDGGFTASCSVIVTERDPVCANPVAINVPYVHDGAGNGCLMASGTIESANSWGMEVLEINGKNVANAYDNELPAPIDGKYYVYYEAANSWSHFELDGANNGGEPVTYTLTVNTVGQGSVNPTGGTFNKGDSVNIIATPVQGWEFSTWSGASTDTNPEINLLMDANKSLTATFTEINTNPDEYTLSVSTTGMGTVNISPDQSAYTQGTQVTLTAIAGSGYQFAGWSRDVTGSENPLTIIMNANNSIEALFTEIPVGGVCDAPVIISLTKEQDGQGEFCWEISEDISYINSWNLDQLEINGVEITNNYVNSFPAKQDGKYFVYYKASVPWAHAEIVGLTPKSVSGFTSDNDGQQSVEIYPNPSSGSIFISGIENGTRVNIYNLAGQVMYSQENIHQHEIELNLGFLPSGSYFISVLNTTKESVTKLIQVK